MASSAGYSGTPLVQKLGIKEGHRVAALGAPDDFQKTLGKLPAAATMKTALDGKDPYDVILLFVTAKKDLESQFAPTAKRLHPAGGFWIAWPKKASGVKTDVTENTVRDIALGEGLVDNKVCAIDSIWSGLRCVVRLADRPSSGKVRRTTR
jgi:hypothetical protein